MAGEKTALIRRTFEGGGKGAGHLFHEAMTSDDPDRVTEIRNTIMAHPGTALAVLRKPGEAGLTGKGEADALDLVLSQVEDDQSQDLMEEHLTAERRVELLQGRGDLPATSAMLVSTSDVIAAMLGDIGAEIDEKSYLLIALPAWAIKLKDRDDFEEILDHQVGEFTIRQYLVMDVYFEAGQASLVTYDMFELVGLDPEEGIDELEALLAGPGDLPEFNPGQVEEAKIRLATRRREIEETPTLAADAKARVDEALEDTGDL